VVEAKLAQMRAKAGVPAPPPANNTPAPSTTSNLKKIPGLDQEDLQRRIAEAKARIAGASQAVSIYFHSAIIVFNKNFRIYYISFKNSAAGGSMSQQRPRGGLNIAPPPLGLDKSGNIDLRAMLDQGIIPKRELATAMVRKFFSGVVLRFHEMNTKVQ